MFTGDFGGTPGRTRIPNLLIRSQTLYPIELRALVQGHKVLLIASNGKPKKDVWLNIERPLRIVTAGPANMLELLIYTGGPVER